MCNALLDSIVTINIALFNKLPEVVIYKTNKTWNNVATNIAVSAVNMENRTSDRFDLVMRIVKNLIAEMKNGDFSGKGEESHVAVINLCYDTRETQTLVRNFILPHYVILYFFKFKVIDVLNTL